LGKTQQHLEENVGKGTVKVRIHRQILSIAFSIVNDKAGGFTQSKRNTNVLLLRRDGTVEKVKRGNLNSKRVSLYPGDEILVLPRVATKHVQIATDIIKVFYQLALSAGVVLRL